MKPNFIRRMLAQYPEWHEKPFRLSYSEIKQPALVFEEFFERYDLDNIRTELKEMVTDALSGALHDDPTMYIGLSDNLEKLVEACFVLHKQQWNETGELPAEKTGTEKLDFHEFSDEEKPEEPGLLVRFTKPVHPLEQIKKDIMKGIHQVFQILDLNKVNKNLASWFHMAICNKSGYYELASQRADLLVYLPQLQRVYEALYAIKETEAIKNYVGRESLSPGLRNELRKDGNFKHLSGEEITRPYQVLNEFFGKFSYRYAHLELRDLLDSAITYEGENPEPAEKLNLLSEYECMSALLFAAFQLNKRKTETLE